MSDTQKWLLRIPKLLTFFMVVALGMTLANLLWMVLTPTSADAQAANLKSTTLIASNTKQENIKTGPQEKQSSNHCKFNLIIVNNVHEPAVPVGKNTIFHNDQEESAYGSSHPDPALPKY